MEIFKPDANNIKPDCLEKDDDFFKHSHGILNSSGSGEYTLCGVAAEEWQYDKILPMKKITCPSCLIIIKECQSYKIKGGQS